MIDKFKIRATTERDAHYLIDIDIKCFDYAWLPEDWRRISKDCLACVATYRETPIGMVIFSDNHFGGIEIEKIAVKPSFCNQGVASQLLFNCALYAREIGDTELIMVIPESRLRPGEPDDLSVWLRRKGFRAEVPLLKNYFTFFGQPEDGVLFSVNISPVVNIDTDIVMKDQP